MASKFQLLEMIAGEAKLVLELPKEDGIPALGANVAFEVPEGVVMFRVLDHFHEYKVFEEGNVASQLRVILIRTGAQKLQKEDGNGPDLKVVPDAE